MMPAALSIVRNSDAFLRPTSGYHVVVQCGDAAFEAAVRTKRVRISADPVTAVLIGPGSVEILDGQARSGEAALVIPLPPAILGRWWSPPLGPLRLVCRSILMSPAALL